jgi:NAD(P)-dependent dehydrogenase (short-subunit alcohol dehydrogenase family)
MENKVAIITGSSGGISLAIAETLAQKGVSVVLNGRTEEKSEQIRDECVVKGGNARSFTASVSAFYHKPASNLL